MSGGASASAATIVAQATGPSRGAIGILRLSGPLALQIVQPLVPEVPLAPEPRRAHLTALCDRRGQRLDQGLLLYFQAPHSYTGEDVVELHAHGSPRLLSLLLAEVLADGRARLAEPGEFTQRAYLNGRMDLSAAEAVADLIAAESEGQVRAAAAQLHGELRARIRALLDPLLALRAEVEGTLDFPIEAEGVELELGERLDRLCESASALFAAANRARLFRRGAKVVLFGPVNAGKSTLFNALVGEARALVDEEPGTTRDVLEAPLEWSGARLTLVDTAGLREQPGRVEALGIERARAAVRGADLAVLVIPPRVSAEVMASWRAEASAPVLLVGSKADEARPDVAVDLAVSARTGEGLELLRSEIFARLFEGGLGEAAVAASERHVEALGRAAEALARARVAQGASTLEVVAGELGLAQHALMEITGEAAGPALLDAIFRRFCIGK